MWDGATTLVVCILLRLASVAIHHSKSSETDDATKTTTEVAAPTDVGSTEVKVVEWGWTAFIESVRSLWEAVTSSSDIDTYTELSLMMVVGTFCANAEAVALSESWTLPSDLHYLSIRDTIRRRISSRASGTATVAATRNACVWPLLARSWSVWGSASELVIGMSAEALDLNMV